MDKSVVKPMGFWSVVMFGVTTIIGSGIFILPSNAAKLMGVSSIFVLIFDALLVTTLALCFAKAASYFDHDGGSFLYAKEAFGDFAGFEVGIMTWGIGILELATMSVGVTAALSAFFPVLKTELGKIILVTLILVVLETINAGGVRVSKVLINTVTITKLIPLLFLVAIGIFFIKGANFTPVLPQTGHVGANTFGQAAVAMFYAFTGFEVVGIVAGDVSDSKKSLPRAIIMVTVIVAIFYVLVQVVALGVLGQKTLAGSALPLQATFGKIAGPIGITIIAVGTLLSMGGNLIANTYSIPRTGSALAENKMMPHWLAKRNRFNAPIVSILFTTVLALLIAYSGSFVQLAILSVVARFAQYIPTCIAVLVFKKDKHLSGERFNLPFGWLIPIIAILVSVWLLFQVTIPQLLWGLGALVIAAPFYLLTGIHKEHVRSHDFAPSVLPEQQHQNIS